MRKLHVIYYFLLLWIPGNTSLTENELQDFLKNVYEKAASEICSKSNFASWNYDRDLNNPEKENKLKDVSLEKAAFDKLYWEKYFKDLNENDYKDFQLKREVQNLKILGEAALSEEKLKQLLSVSLSMVTIYSTAKICPYKKQNCDLESEGLSLNPDIEELFAKSTNYEELLYMWTAWRNASGAKIKELYKENVALSNEAAVANGFKDLGELWRFDYESSNFIEDVDNIWNQVEPLYIELHKYVGNKLKMFYGEAFDTSDGLLPAHIFGNMWGQHWNNIANLVKPFPNASKIDIDAALLDHNYTVRQMFETADDFYMSMGLIPNGISYDTRRGAMIEKPKGNRAVVCHGSAWDFCDGKNYRISMCTKINFEDFVTIHHEMGHIQYYLQYKNLPISFRNGANPGFHEAIGDTIALSVTTPKHLQKIGLLKDYKHNEESSLNHLMDMALEKVAFLPFGLLIDKWRWDVFKGTVKPSEWNSHWWYYRKKYQKMKPPVTRSDEHDFDPGAKFHVADNDPYIAYFVAHILQFQFYKGLCVAAGEYDLNNRNKLLHDCDFYKSIKAGKKLSAGLSLGSSHHWNDALEAITGERQLNASALLEYFNPLYEYLKEYNSKT